MKSSAAKAVTRGPKGVVVLRSGSPAKFRAAIRVLRGRMRLPRRPGQRGVVELLRKVRGEM